MNAGVDWRHAVAALASMDGATSFRINQGSAGPFMLSGSLTDSTTSPSD